MAALMNRCFLKNCIFKQIKKEVKTTQMLVKKVEVSLTVFFILIHRKQLRLKIIYRGSIISWFGVFLL